MDKLTILAISIQDEVDRQFAPTSYTPAFELKIGKPAKHPDGRNVMILSGCYRDPIYNRISNFWYWKEIFADGSLGKEESGYWK